MKEKLYKFTAICTAIFAVLCCIIMIVFFKNQAFFDSHGKLGNLAELERMAYEQENSKVSYQKKNIAVSIEDNHNQELKIPLQTALVPEQVVVREEFTKNKIVITLQDAGTAVADHTKIISDSDYMKAIGVYKQKNDTVLELYCNFMYAYQYQIAEGALTVTFTPLREQFKQLAVIYIPMEQKSRLSADEWKNDIKALSEEKRCKVFICSDMQESYDEQSVINFANQIRADYVMAVTIKKEGTESDIEILCNPEFFIPEFGSIELSTLFGEKLQKETQLSVKTLQACTTADLLVYQATMPVTMAQIYLPTTHSETIEEEYAFNHTIMEALKATLLEMVGEA